MAMSSIKLSTATGLSADSDKQYLKGYYVTSLSLVPRPSRLHAIILRTIIWVAFEKREGLGTRLTSLMLHFNGC